jgi:hypothetical protein
LKLDTFRQPAWAMKVNKKDVLKKLTSVTVTAFCDRCAGTKGTVAVDNVAFVE